MKRSTKYARFIALGMAINVALKVVGCCIREPGPSFKIEQGVYVVAEGEASPYQEMTLEIRSDQTLMISIPDLGNGESALLEFMLVDEYSRE